MQYSLTYEMRKTSVYKIAAGLLPAKSALFQNTFIERWIFLSAPTLPRAYFHFPKSFKPQHIFALWCWLMTIFMNKLPMSGARIGKT